MLVCVLSPAAPTRRRQSPGFAEEAECALQTLNTYLLGLYRKSMLSPGGTCGALSLWAESCLWRSSSVVMCDFRACVRTVWREGRDRRLLPWSRRGRGGPARQRRPGGAGEDRVARFSGAQGLRDSLGRGAGRAIPSCLTLGYLVERVAAVSQGPSEKPVSGRGGNECGGGRGQPPVSVGPPAADAFQEAHCRVWS